MHLTFNKFLVSVIIIFFCGAVNAKSAEKELKILQFNIWQEGTVVPGGFEGIVNNIISLNPDLITFSEVRNYKQVDFIPHLVRALAIKGKTYFGEVSASTGIISRYKIEKQEVVFPLGDDHGSVLKASVKIDGKEVVLYSAHLDYLNCAYYLPRGYGSSDWRKLEAPVTDIDSLHADNRNSQRDDQVRAILKDVQKEKAKESIIFIGGDFNEPSHLDWQKDTKDIRDHQGVVINWDCSVLITEGGFIDSYREKYPDPVAYPGFTYPSNNMEVDVKRLAWGPDADERERIDFIYYHPHPAISLKDVQVVGPLGFILKGQRDNGGNDPQHIVPKDVWPTDHNAILATFIIY